MERGGVPKNTPIVGNNVQNLQNNLQCFGSKFPSDRPDREGEARFPYSVKENTPGIIQTEPSFVGAVRREATDTSRVPFETDFDVRLMPYPEAMVNPMREELTRLGVEELTTADDVDAAFDEAIDETMLLVINSVCGCAAGNARPAVAMAKEADVQPDRYVTVFAGQDLEATEQVRDQYLAGIPPSSPFLALFRDGQPVYIVERKHIEGRSANAIAADLVEAFEAYCTDEEPPSDAPARPDTSSGSSAGNGLPSTFQSIN